MAGQGDRVLYIGTDDALYQATPEDGGFQARLVGLQGLGGVRGLVFGEERAPAGAPQWMVACTGRAGIFRSDDGGSSWQERNQGIVYKELWSLARHPATGELYAGSGPASVFKSTDGGDTWTFCEQIHKLRETRDWDFPQPPHVAHVRWLAFPGGDPSLVMAAVEVGWMLRSTDGGATWENVQDGIERDSHSLAFMPDDPEVVMATTGNGLFRSSDGGRSFSRVTEGVAHLYMTQIVVHPERPKVLFTAGAETPPHLWFRRPEGANSGFYRSDDQGLSWRRLTGGLPEVLRAAPRAVCGDPADPDAFYVGMIDGSVWLSEDGGESFRQVVRDLPGWVRYLAVARA